MVSSIFHFKVDTQKTHTPQTYDGPPCAIVLLIVVQASNIEALIIRIGYWGPLYYIIRNPQSCIINI